MNLQAQREKAETLRSLHRGPRSLVLPNVWDVVTARIVEEMGFPVVATTSAGIASSLGYADGQHIGMQEMLSVVARIASAVRLPVSADLEAGYGLTPEAMAQTARHLIATGAVGLNLEDTIGHGEESQVSLPLQVAKIRALRQAANSEGVPLVLNARTDIYLLGIGDPATRFERTVERLHAYREAGADCLFVPGVRDADTIRRLVAEAGAPLNILAGPGSPSVSELERLGVARISLGSSLARAALTNTKNALKELLDTGTYSLLEGSLSCAEVNQLVQRNPR
jgi:2-methylisocitrate lyase-like PEP mutase family enzyme